MYINLRYEDNEALMNFIEKDGKYILLCDADSNKVDVIKNNNNKTILIKDGEEFNVSVEWVEDEAKVEAIWEEFEELEQNYFPSPENLFGMILTIEK